LRPLALSILPETLAVTRLPPASPVPAWAHAGPLQSVTRTADELSIVCAAGAVPDGSKSERGWRALRVAGPLDFSLTGVLVSLLAPLADAAVTVFAVSTHDTDYLLVKEESLARAADALRRAGHRLKDESR
jgi:uncharacterized protein